MPRGRTRLLSSIETWTRGGRLAIAPVGMVRDAMRTPLTPKNSAGLQFESLTIKTFNYKLKILHPLVDNPLTPLVCQGIFLPDSASERHDIAVNGVFRPGVASEVGGSPKEYPHRTAFARTLRGRLQERSVYQ